MIVDEKEPIIPITFVPVLQDDGTMSDDRSYTFKCRAINNPVTKTVDIDMIFTDDYERKEYAEFEKKRDSGVQYYADMPDLK